MLHVHRAERADLLVAALADVLAEPLEDPLATEVVAVHSRGIERWIAQELSARLGTGLLGGDGVCAGVDFPFPGRLVQEAIARGSRIDPDDDPWVPQRLVWPLLELVDADPHAAMLGPLRPHVGDGESGTGAHARRFGAVRHVADLFDRYGVHRPEMVVRWREGEDVGADGRKLDPRHRWQPALWRAVRERVGVPAFAERWDTAVSALHDDPDLLDLSERLALFGLTALPATYLQVVSAIAVHRTVHLLLLHPSRSLWTRVDEAVGARRPLPLRDDDPTARLPRNPLLRSWGRDVRELQLLAPLGGDVRMEHHARAEPPPRTLLERIQHGVRADRHPGAPATTRGPGAADTPVLDPSDRSIQLHNCHGRLRQVEVLREAILHLLAETPDLQPRDIIAMCPDIETFAPLVTAVFGTEATDPAAAPPDAPPALRVRLADRSLRRTNPLVDVVSQLLDLVGGRVAASDVLDLLARQPVRRRFALTSDDVELIETWVGDLQIRWGFDEEHRRDHGLPPLQAHTWQAGVERLLLGATMADEELRMIAGVVPYDGVEGGDTDLAGRLVELLARLSDCLDELSAARPADQWRDTVARVADRLTLAAPGEEWQRLQLHRVLDGLVAEATAGGRVSPVALTLAELQTALAQRLAGGPSRTGHRTGDLTISTLVPMRSVPHRVVCLLGLDDGTFPRQLVPDGDDLLLAAPRVGDRDPRSEDRQLLLDAVLAATETLVVTYAGRDERTNEERPPAVPVDELRDVIDRTVVVADGGRPSDAVTVRHCLAEHDPRNFTAGGLRGTGPDWPWGFDQPTLEAAERHRADSRPAPPFLAEPLPAIDEDVIDLDDLIRFLEHPAKAFVRRRLDVTLRGAEDEISDAIPAQLRGLDEWKVGDALLQGWFEGRNVDRVLDVERAKGQVPAGDLATADLTELRACVDAVMALAQRYGVQPGRPRGRTAEDVAVDLPDGRTLVGTVPGINGDLVTALSYSRVKPKHRLAAWARYLAVNAAYPDRPWKAVTAGRNPRKQKAKACVVRLLELDLPPDRGRATALDKLLLLVDLYDRGMRSPLPLYCASSARAAEELRRDEDPAAKVGYAWESSDYGGFDKEDRDPYHLLVLGGQVPTAALFDELCVDDEEASWADDPRRFVAYAWRLWAPVLAAEVTCTG